MASNGAIQRPSATTRSASMVDPGEPISSTIGTNWNDFKFAEFKLVCPFKIPSSPEAAILRIIRNLNHFALYYTHFVWIILFISLIPKRKVSLILLVIMTYVGSLFLLLLRAVPSSNIVHKILDKRVVLSVIVVASMVELVLTHAGIHLLVSLAGSLPVVLVHAVLWVREDFSVEEKSSGGVGVGPSGELLPLVQDSSAGV
ncbi:hypothetical protein P3X46_010437 [Hevea brasiliensis]|uniref:PRA1 family protein n=1 Tax=Hevea brasiliensis TaxID=3981 RepID=A0ABQ9ME36_HEVBR|nr:PRA1 family protein F2 [Hevea brasiliensis]XP_058005256.1 PRA1 family protein F2-like [Hevea brasiliensis]KAJ9178346.1 hypothetical protein P3X46_010236 [Hevea brasiliensis]KAJ9178561.1 hypothetical protein P3X46_010437 [Hevea brasiliensis]